MPELQRCRWAGSDPLLQAYHDEEWGRPEWDSRALWEKLMLDGFQAGLSWLTILRRRDAFRQAFADFDPHLIAGWGSDKVEELLGNAAIIRSRAKIQGVIGNARAYVALSSGGQDFSRLIWDLAGGKPIVNHWPEGMNAPAKTDLSLQISKTLRKRGFTFVGPVIVYAWMQATGIVDDHEPCCHCRLATGC